MRFRHLVPLVALLPLAHVACVGDDPTPGSSGAAGEDGGASGNDGGTGSSSSSSGGGDASSDAPVAISKVSGVVVSDVGTPVVGAIVRVEGRPESVTTGADGKFSLDAPPTYDLTVAYPSNGTTSGSAVIAVLGLTTRAPSIEVVAGTTRKSPSVTLGVSGAGAGFFPLGTSNYVAFAFAPTANAEASGKLLLPGSNGSNAFTNYSWRGDAAASGNVHAFRYTIDDTTKLPTAFTASGQTSFTLTEGAAATFTVPMYASSSAHVAGTIDYAGATPSSLSYTIRATGTSGHTFSSFTYDQASFDLPMPSSTSYKAAVGVSGRGPGGGLATAWRVGLSQGVTNVKLVVPAEIAPTAPVDDARGVDATATTFSWQAAPAPFGTYQLAVSCGPGGLSVPEYSVTVLTASASAKLPDASKLGVSVPSGKTCTWSATAMTAGSADDLAGPTGWLRFAQMRAATADGRVTTTVGRSFGTK